VQFSIGADMRSSMALCITRNRAFLQPYFLGTSLFIPVCQHLSFSALQDSRMIALPLPPSGSYPHHEPMPLL
jgi:hypothetical protein